MAIAQSLKRPLLGTVTLVPPIIVAVLIALTVGPLSSSAVQMAEMHLDMQPAFSDGNTYSNPGLGGNNTMTVGAIDPCLTTTRSSYHTHNAHLIIQNVEDLVAWTARFNYIGDKMRPSSFSATPFSDTSSGEIVPVGFLNLPIDSGPGKHRDVVTAWSVPPQPAIGTNTPQTGTFGAALSGPLNFAIAPDTPHKTVPDDSSYNAPNGGVLASVKLMIPYGDGPGDQYFMNLDDNNPSGGLGSELQIFTGTGLQTVTIPPERLGDGFHGEGVPCAPQDCVTQECPSITPASTSPPSPSPSVTATPIPTLQPTQPATASPTLTPGAILAPTAGSTESPAQTPAALAVKALPTTGGGTRPGSSAAPLLFGGALALFAAVICDIVRRCRKGAAYSHSPAYHGNRWIASGSKLRLRCPARCDLCQEPSERE